MGKHRVWVQTVILAALVLVGGFAIGQSLFFGNDTPREGNKAPGFSLLGMDDKTHRLEDYRGKPLIINFWASWCEPCKVEMPAIQNQYMKWKDKGVQVIGMNLDEPQVTVQSFVKQYQLTFPILYDPGWVVRDLYGVTKYPTTFFIDASGEIRLIKLGVMDEAFIDETLSKLTASK
jgi:peroxiredoxin